MFSSIFANDVHDFFIFHSIVTTAKFFDSIKHLDSWQSIISKMYVIIQIYKIKAEPV